MPHGSGEACGPPSPDLDISFSSCCNATLPVRLSQSLPSQEGCIFLKHSSPSSSQNPSSSSLKTNSLSEYEVVFHVLRQNKCKIKLETLQNRVGNANIDIAKRRERKSMAGQTVWIWTISQKKCHLYLVGDEISAYFKRFRVLVAQTLMPSSYIMRIWRRGILQVTFGINALSSLCRTPCWFPWKLYRSKISRER